jgi:pyruvate,water dikinase
VRVIEERAALQQTAFGSMKVPILALGRALVAAGVVGSPGDAFYLTRAELRALASGPGAGFDARAVVERRKGELVGWGRLLPPAFVGAPPGEIDNGAAASVVRPPAPLGSLRGIGASRGIAHGRAFVARSLDEAERLEPGDILVCVFTSPPWTPLFAIAGGIVCDAGGVLGHAAITAREYGIPAVLGTHTATRDIPHGARITIDGAAGTVTIGA